MLASALLAVAAPVPGDAKTLRTNLRADPAMVDPVTYSELVAGDVMKNLYEGFTEIDKDGNVVPALATRWEASADNKGFRFFLRKGVKFHSGREFTAKDVKWTFEQILLPGNKGGLTLTYLKVLEGAQEILDGKTTQLSGVKVVDPYTVEVRFTKPDVLFPIYPFQFMDSGIVAQHGADWHTKVWAGTGPFKFVHWKRGQEVRLAAHKDYWDKAPAPCRSGRRRDGGEDRGHVIVAPVVQDVDEQVGAEPGGHGVEHVARQCRQSLVLHRAVDDAREVEHGPRRVGEELEHGGEELAGAAADVADGRVRPPVECGEERQGVHPSAGRHGVVERGPPIGVLGHPVEERRSVRGEERVGRGPAQPRAVPRPR